MQKGRPIMWLMSLLCAHFSNMLMILLEFYQVPFSFTCISLLLSLCHQMKSPESSLTCPGYHSSKYLPSNYSLLNIYGGSCVWLGIQLVGLNKSIILSTSSYDVMYRSKGNCGSSGTLLVPLCFHHMIQYDVSTLAWDAWSSIQSRLAHLPLGPECWD